MANIKDNISAFNDFVGDASMKITLQKRLEIFSVKKESESSFVKFLKKTKGWVDEMIVGKFILASTHLKPVIKLAIKDATMLFAACLSGKIISQFDDANYSVTKEQFIDLVVLNTEFKDDFEKALVNLDKKNCTFTFCKVFTVYDIIYNNPYIELLRPELPFYFFL
jgi:hypothetical protein